MFIKRTLQNDSLSREVNIDQWIFFFALEHLVPIHASLNIEYFRQKVCFQFNKTMIHWIYILVEFSFFFETFLHKDNVC